MANIKYTKIKIENFCGVKYLENELTGRTIIKGKNGVGKSTIKNAIAWVLTDKLSDGSAADGIRPHDKDGKDIDFVDISVELTTELDGREVVFKKTQKQNWVKDRTTQEQVFKGNDNTFEINGIPKKAGDYTAYIEENISKMEILRFCTNPLSFLALDTKKRRAKLFELVEDFTNENVIDAHPEFESIRDSLKDGTIDELITRSRNKINLFKKTLAELPARIDEVSKQIIDKDFAELELAKNSLLEEQAKNTNAIAETEKNITDMTTEIMKVDMDRNAYVIEANKETNDKLYKAREDLSARNNEMWTIQRSLDEINTVISRDNDALKNLESDIELYEKSIANIQAEKFDESLTVCPTCGREYPHGHILDLKDNFAHAKENSIKEYARLKEASEINAQNMRNTISGKEKVRVELETSLQQKNAECEKCKLIIEEIENAGTEIVDTSKFTSRIEKLESDKYNLSVVLDKMFVHEAELKESLSGIAAELSQKDTNIKLEERIAELQAEQRNVSQNIANEEKMLDTLEAFNRAKVRMLTDKVNSYFEVIKWRLFERQINGGYADVCRAIVNGTDYDRTLNNGDKILAEIDICRAFMKANKLNVPVVFDNAESLDSNRIPAFDGQLIAVQRTDDEILTIERR